MAWTQDPFAGLGAALDTVMLHLTKFAERDAQAKKETLEQLLALSKHASTMRAVQPPPAQKDPPAHE